MTYEYDFLVFIGRFQPFHNGHKHVIEEALTQSKRVIVLVGSPNVPRSYRNPWTYEERVEMIQKSFTQEECKRIDFNPISDMTYNNTAWTAQVQEEVKNVTWNFRAGKDQKIGLIGYSKDNTSFYLKMFPQWGSINVEQKVVYNATDIRRQYFTRNPHVPREICPEPVANFLADFLYAEDFKKLVSEQEYIRNYRKQQEVYPYPITFNTSDAVVIQSGHILLIERKAAPGQGLLALPGGFLDPGETLFEGAIRELRQETGLKVPEKVLRGSFKRKETFDDPNRSDRGRVITQAFLFELEPQLELPKVKGSSDAKRAFWAPIGQLNPKLMFEDHFFIAHYMLGLGVYSK
jgi:bifunctional NMN adenylyltransferase/nudix hydrolase